MGMPLVDGIAFLSQIEPAALFVMFWHTILLEMPRYVISGAVVAVAAAVAPTRRGPPPRLSVSVLLPTTCGARCSRFASRPSAVAIPSSSMTGRATVWPRWRSG